MEGRRGPAPSVDQGWAERTRLSLGTRPRGRLGPANESSDNRTVPLFPRPPERAPTSRPCFPDESPGSRSFPDVRDHGAGRGRGQNWNRLPRDPRQSPRRCSHMEGRPRRAEEGVVAQRKRETWVLKPRTQRRDLAPHSAPAPGPRFHAGQTRPLTKASAVTRDPAWRLDLPSAEGLSASLRPDFTTLEPAHRTSTRRNTRSGT